MDHDNKTLLLVEDEALIALMEKKWLESEGYQVIHAFSGEKAIEHIRNGDNISLVLMDIDLGKDRIDGTEAASIILKERDIPLLFLSSHTEKEIVEKTEAITSYGYVVKGSTHTVLSASIKMAFKLHSAYSDLRESDIKVRKSEARLNRAEITSKCGNWELHLESGIMIASEGACKIYGLEGSSWPLSEVKKIPLQEYRPVLDQALKDLVAKGIPYDHEFKITNAITGRIIDVHSKAEYDREKKILFGVIQDITERKTAEQERMKAEAGQKESDHLFQSSFINASTGMAITTLKGQFMKVNPALCRMSGYTEEELLGMTFIEITHPDDIDKDLGELEKVMAGQKESFQMEKRYIRKSGDIVWVLLSVSVVRSATGEPKFIIGQMQDITDKKVAELR